MTVVVTRGAAWYGAGPGGAGQGGEPVRSEASHLDVSLFSAERDVRRRRQPETAHSPAASGDSPCI